MTFKELEAKAAEMAAEIEALKAENAKLKAENATLTEALAAKAAAPSLVASEVLVLIHGLRHNGKVYAPGDLMPFDPAKPPPGCDGLLEGVHYRKERVLSHAP